jgi:AraC-like DNA-binding protein
MLFFSPENINLRCLGEAYPDEGTPLYQQSLRLADRHFQLAHRHRISLIDDYTPPEKMNRAWTARLSGELFTPARGYRGPGQGVGNNVYSIGTYGSWPWQEEGEAAVYKEMYRDYLPGKIYFNCDQFKLKLPMALCRKPNASANHESYHLALQQCESMLARLQTHEPDYRTRLKKMMLSRPPGTLSEEEAAATLFMSKRTLARKLKRENSSFRQIREEVLSRQAASYLCDSQMSVEAIATLLNYHDTASFRRAFKRWFGLTPDQYRQGAH